MVGLGASPPPVTTDSVAVDLGLDLGLFVPLVVLGFDLFAGISGLSSLSLQGPHQVGKSGKSREFCDRSGSRENVGKNKTP